MDIKKLKLTPGGAENKHIMTSKKGIKYEVVPQTGGQSIMFSLNDWATIDHDEHDKIVLEKGEYAKTNQMEYNPFTKTISYVYD